MTFMPLASVVDVHLVGARARASARRGFGGCGAAPAAAPSDQRAGERAQRADTGGLRHADTSTRGAHFNGHGKEKRRDTGEVVCGAEEANTGEELFAVLC